MKEEHFTIGKMASAAEVSIETIRYYEREGLIPEPPRRSSGYRQYTPATIDRIRFIKQAKDLGFTLAEIKELLSLSIGPKTTCANVRSIAKAKIADIDAKITALKYIRLALAKLADQCQGGGPVSDCPILEALRKPKKRKTKEETL